MKFTKKSILMLVAVLVLLAFTFWGYPQLVNFLQADICLDEGGQWNAEQQACLHE